MRGRCSTFKRSLTGLYDAQGFLEGMDQELTQLRKRLMSFIDSAFCRQRGFPCELNRASVDIKTVTGEVTGQLLSIRRIKRIRLRGRRVRTAICVVSCFFSSSLSVDICNRGETERRCVWLSRHSLSREAAIKKTSTSFPFSVPISCLSMLQLFYTCGLLNCLLINCDKVQ